MRKWLLAVAASLLPLLASASIVSGGGATHSRGSVLWDSTSVTTGAAIDSGVLDLSAFSELQVVVDNTSGTALRDVVLSSYLDDSVTLIGTVTVRRVPSGGPPVGSTYAPGMAQGYVGPNPPGGTTGVHVLYDSTSATNGTLDTGPLSTSECDSVFSAGQASAGTTTVTNGEVRDDGSQFNFTAPSASANQQFFAGSGVSVAGQAYTASSMPFVPRRMAFQSSAAGTGNTVRLRVLCRGRVPGTFAYQMVLPTKARFQLGAGGSGAARLTIIGR